MTKGSGGMRAWLFATAVATATTALWSGQALAHHSFSAEFDIGSPVEITGTVLQIEWTNPHAWIHIETVEGNGDRERWAVELLGINALVRGGLSPQTVKAGDRLTVTGYRAKNGTNTANASTLTRTDTGERLWTTRGERD